MAELPSFEVVIPARNAAVFLSAAVASALAAGASRVIVVDDGSSDRTSLVATELGCLVIRLEGAGAGRARRAGHNLVRAPFVVYLDADDELVADGVHASLRLLALRSDAVGCVGATLLDGVDGGSRTMIPPKADVTLRDLIARGHAPAPPASFVWRSPHAKDSGGLALDPAFAEDYELALRQAFGGPVITHGQTSARYRTGGGKSTRFPLRGLREAERMRSHYAAVAGIDFRPHTERQLRALVQWRRATEPAPNRTRAARVWAAAAAVTSAPILIGRRVVRRVLRQNADG